MAQDVPTCQFEHQLSTALLNAGEAQQSHSHSHVLGGLAANHNHDLSGTWTPEEHGHSHEHLEHAGR